ncbi:MAG: RloB domain-containing protein [Armatimonadetes bacterium]|nr:RloB domain-containing protein [Armatimonadota bacterium]
MAKHGPGTRRRSQNRNQGADQIAVRERFLIVCEGTETEPRYFQNFDAPGRVLEVRGTGMNTLSLVNEAIRLRAELETDRPPGQEPFDQCWCVFDRDSFGTFNEAIDKARANGFRAAYTNEAFELWYLLHFDYHDAALSRQQYGDKLSDLLRRRYEKDDPTMYAALLPRQEAAIQNAERLMARYDPHNPQRDNPCTTVHELVKELRRNSRP